MEVNQTPKTENPQIVEIEKFLDWLKTCPSTAYTISSMQGGFFHVKFMISPSDEKRIAKMG